MPPPGPEQSDEFAALYDERTLARIDRVAPACVGVREPAADPAAPRAVLRWAAGPILAAALLAVGDVLDPAGTRPEIVEFVPEAPDEHEQLVSFVHVPGDPRASRLIVRPWLLVGGDDLPRGVACDLGSVAPCPAST